MANKKYFWLKLKEDFFKKREIKKLRRLAGGDTYTIIYLQMQLLAIKNDGKIYFEGTERDIYEQLEIELDEDVENIRMTIHYLLHNNLLELNEQEDCFLPDTLNSIGKESESAERVRKYRENKKNKTLQCNGKKLLSNSSALHCNVDVTKSNTEIEIEIEKDLEKEKDEQKTKIVIDFYSKNIGLVSPLLLEEIGSYLNYGIDPALINESIKIACINNKKSWGYIKAIINNSLTKGIKTLEDFTAKEVEFQNKKMKVTQKTKSIGHEANFDQRPVPDDYEQYYYKVTE